MDYVFFGGALRAGIIILQHDDDEKRLCIKRNVYESHFLGYFQIKLRNNNGLLSLYVRNAYRRQFACKRTRATIFDSRVPIITTIS